MDVVWKLSYSFHTKRCEFFLQQICVYVNACVRVCVCVYICLCVYKGMPVVIKVFETWGKNTKCVALFFFFFFPFENGKLKIASFFFLVSFVTMTLVVTDTISFFSTFTSLEFFLFEWKCTCASGKCVWRVKMNKDCQTHHLSLWYVLCIKFSLISCWNGPEVLIRVSFKTAFRLTSHQLNMREVHCVYNEETDATKVSSWWPCDKSILKKNTLKIVETNWERLSFC